MILVLLSTTLSQALAFKYLLDLFWFFQTVMKITALVLFCGFLYQLLFDLKKHD
jgi:hypothetical protein